MGALAPLLLCRCRLACQSPPSLLLPLLSTILPVNLWTRENLGQEIEVPQRPDVLTGLNACFGLRAPTRNP